MTDNTIQTYYNAAQVMACGRLISKGDQVNIADEQVVAIGIMPCKLAYASPDINPMKAASGFLFDRVELYVIPKAKIPQCEIPDGGDAAVKITFPSP